MKVWCYPLVPEEGFESLEEPPGAPGTSYTAEVEMEPGAQIIEAAWSTKGPALYALVEGTGVTEPRSFVVCGNDVELPDDVGVLQHVGTAKVMGGPTVHVFDAATVKAGA
jgi:hypothetical protein